MSLHQKIATKMYYRLKNAQLYLIKATEIYDYFQILSSHPPSKLLKLITSSFSPVANSRHETPGDIKKVTCNHNRILMLIRSSYLLYSIYLMRKSGITFDGFYRLAIEF